MAKDFKGGLDSLLGENNSEENTQSSTPKRGRPKTANKEITSSSHKGTKEGEVRATIIINEENLQKMKAIAYWDRVLIKDVINDALQSYLDTKSNVKGRPLEVRVKEQEDAQRLLDKKGNGGVAKLSKY